MTCRNPQQRKQSQSKATISLIADVRTNCSDKAVVVFAVEQMIHAHSHHY